MKCWPVGVIPDGDNKISSNGIARPGETSYKTLLPHKSTLKIFY